MTTDELRARLDDPALAVVDTRPLHLYNGWRAPGAERGGHLPGAISFPAEWEGILDDADIGDVLVTKGITTEREVALYGSDARVLAERLTALGYTNVSTFDDLEAWASDGALPLARLPRYERLVHVDWLRAVLDGKRPEAAPAGRFRLFHVNFGVPEEYAESHLPGAFYLDTNWLENPVDWNRRTPAELEEATTRLGITHDTTVVLYGRDTEGRANEKWPGRRAGQIAAAARGAHPHLLRRRGRAHSRRRVRPLGAGGQRARDDASGALPRRVVRRHDPGAPGGHRRPRRGEGDPGRPERRRPRERPDLARAHRRGQRLQLHRARRPDRGRRLGQLRLRRVPHAALPQRGQHDARVSRDRRQLGGRRHHGGQVGRVLLRDGLARERDVVLRAPMGWENVAVYDGGWFEWSKDPEQNPIEFGLETAELVA